jgi:hypothetical protein
MPKNRQGPGRRFLGPLDRLCIANGIERRLTKPYTITRGPTAKPNG